MLITLTTMERRLLIRCNAAKSDTEFYRIEAQIKDSHRPKPNYTSRDIDWIKKETSFEIPLPKQTN